jgi:hypothetical protein
MRLRALSSVTAALLLTLVSADVQSQSRGYAVPRTPWGEPDLQGTYNATDLQSVPMQRAESLGTRDTLNDAEVRERVARRDEALAHDNSDEFTLEHAEEFANKFPTVFWGGVAPPPHWLERVKHVSRIASIVIDPPNGRIPALTLEAQKAAQERQQAQAARRKALNGIEAEWTTDRSNYDRCISLGVQGSMTPKIYNSATRIVQGPGWVAIQNEMIHETRMTRSMVARTSPARSPRGWATPSDDGTVTRWSWRRAMSSRSHRSTASRCRRTVCSSSGSPWPTRTHSIIA